MILTQQYHGGNESPYEGTFLKFPITAVDIVTFIKLNKKYLVGKDGKLGFNPKGDVDVKLPTVKRLEQVDDFDAEIIEFDDKSCKSMTDVSTFMHVGVFKFRRVRCLCSKTSTSWYLSFFPSFELQPELALWQVYSSK